MTISTETTHVRSDNIKDKVIVTQPVRRCNYCGEVANVEVEYEDRERNLIYSCICPDAVKEVELKVKIAHLKSDLYYTERDLQKHIVKLSPRINELTFIDCVATGAKQRNMDMSHEDIMRLVKRMKMEIKLSNNKRQEG